jgi:hypothetical protein
MTVGCRPAAELTAARAVRNADPAAVFVVQGASRGLGLELCRQLLARTAGTVRARSGAARRCAQPAQF